MLTKSDYDKLYGILGEQIIDLERASQRQRYTPEYKQHLQRRLNELTALHDKVYEAWKEVAGDY